MQTLEELLAEGQRQLAAQRAAEAECAAVETARIEAEQQTRRATVLAGIATIVPEALMPFVQIEVDFDAIQCADLVLPDCTPIHFCYDMVSGKRYAPWRVARAQGTDWTRHVPIPCDDLPVALAHAAEQGARMAQARVERAVQEARNAEDAAYAQTTRHDAESAEPIAVPQRTLAEQIEALLREIIREEIGNA